MSYNIEKKTPASNWVIIHRGFELDTAKYLLKEIAENYDQDEDRWNDSFIDEDGMSMTAYEGGDCHQFRIVET